MQFQIEEIQEKDYTRFQVKFESLILKVNSINKFLIKNLFDLVARQPQA